MKAIILKIRATTKKILIKHLEVIIAFVIILLSFIARILLTSRVSFAELLNTSLWSQNGSIFVHQTFAYGIKSLWIPSMNYSIGYMQLYPRLIAVAAVSFIKLSFMPYVFFVGWLLVVVVMSIVITNIMKQYQISTILSGVIIALVNLQPNYGLNFFNIINTQYMIGLTLVVYLLLDKNLRLTWISLPLLIIACLTGPFSLIISPILLLKIYFKNDLRKNFIIYIIVFISALIQGWFILKSGKISTPMIGPTDTDLTDWIKAISIFLVFGGKNIAVIIFSIVFWGIYSYLLKQLLKNRNIESVDDFFDNIILLFTSLLFYFAALVVARAHPLGINPLGAASKYYAIPYGLIFIAIILASRSNSKIKATALTLKTLICVISLI